MTDRRSLWLPILLAAGVLPAVAPAAPRSSLPPLQVGPYRLREEIGAGGMGTVYRAEQRAPIWREVAVKVVRDDAVGGDGSDGPSRELLRQRLRLERQLLALVDHEHVVRLLDAGDTDTGDPWLAMELIRGRPITAFCDDGALAIHARLEVFDEVCRAVEHLHARGIEHRDLKPDNVLVVDRDGRAVPKLVDFGLATLSGHALAAGDGAAGTPTHMAPEQFRLAADAVDQRADVHALGVMLYELLVGALPYAPGPELARRPRAPSDRLGDPDIDAERVAAERGSSAPGLVRELRRGLDAVALTAVHPRREQRFASVGALRRAVAAARVARPAWWRRMFGGRAPRA